MGFPFLQPLKPGEDPTKVINQLIALVGNTRGSNGTSSIGVFNSMLGPSVRDYSLTQHWAKIALQTGTNNTGTTPWTAVDNHGHGEVYFTIDNDGQSTVISLTEGGITGEVDVDGTDATDSVFQTVEASGRLDTPDDEILQITPHPTGEYFLHRWFPPCTIFENSDLVTSTSATLVAGDTTVVRLGSLYLNRPQNDADRTYLAIGSLSCYGEIDGKMSPDTSQSIACHAVVSFQRYDADDPTDAQERTARAELVWACQQDTVTIEDFTVSGGTYSVTGGGGGTVEIPDQKFSGVSGTYNTSGIMAGSAVVMVTMREVQGDSGAPVAPLGGVFPSTIATKVNFDLFVRSVGYSGDITLTMTGSAFPLGNHFEDIDGTEVQEDFNPVLRVIQISDGEPIPEPDPTPP